MNLTEEQRTAVQQGQSVRLQENGTEVVVLRADVFERLRNAVYDDSAWSDEEMDLLAAENADLIGWEGMEGYQDRKQ